MKTLCMLALVLVLCTSAGAEVTVVATSPANGATDVAPGNMLLQIRFSGPIKPGGYSLPNNQYGEPVEFVGEPELSQNNTVFTWMMKLRPGVKYSTSVNDARFQNFRGQDGQPVRPYPLIFTTSEGGSASAPPTTGAAPSATEVHVVRTYPENGAKGVDPKLTYIRVRFSSPVQEGGYSLVSTGEGEEIQFVGKPKLQDGGMLFIASVMLKPGITYSVGINNANYRNFRSAKDPRVSVTPYVLTFTTAGKRAQAEPADRIKAWQEDVDFLAEQLPQKHIDLFFKLTEEQWRHSATALRQSIPTLNDTQICCELIKLVSKVGDEHTCIDAKVSGDQRMLPIGLYWFSDGIFVVGAQDNLKELLRCNVETVGGLPLDQAIAALSPLLPDVNDALRKKALPYYLCVPQYLEGCGVVEEADKVAYGVKTAEGKSATVEVAAVQPSEDMKMATVLDSLAEKPLYLNNLKPNYWAKTIDDGRVVYFQYNQCRSASSYPFSRMQGELRRMLADGRVKRLVIDLRHNAGGSSPVLNPFIAWLAGNERFNKKGDTIVLIGRRTFSSAILNALDLKNKANAVFIGEPTSGSPNHYGEVETFKLPNSGFTVGYSTKHFEYSDDGAPSVMPDVKVEISSADYFAGKDPVLEAALKY